MDQSDAALESRINDAIDALSEGLTNRSIAAAARNFDLPIRTLQITKQQDTFGGPRAGNVRVY